ncbi:MAG: nuclear transport factor 2 family protein [Gammaproteobacteria bacterium]
MDYAEKLALATRVVELTIRPFTETIPPDRPLPQSMRDRLDEMTNRRRVLMAQLYAERLSEDQLLALERHHGSDQARSVAALMPGIVADAQKRFVELWGSGKGMHNVAVDHDGVSARIGVKLVVDGPARDTQPAEAGAKGLPDDEHFIQTTHAHPIREYLRAVEGGATGTALARFYTRDAEQIERPNRLNPAGGRSDLPTLLARAEKGRDLLRAQRYEVLSLVAEGQRVATEVLWSGTLAVAVGTLAAGATLRAHIAMFFDMKDGLIYRQRNYDCFEAW